MATNAQVIASSTAAAQSAAAAVGGSYTSNAGGTGGFTPGSSTPAAVTSTYTKAGGSIPTTTAATPYTAPATINSNNTANNPDVQLPTPPTATNTGTQAMTSITGLANASGTTPTTTATPPTQSETDFQTYLKSLVAPTSTADLYQNDQENADIAGKTQAVNNYQAQLNAISAKASADKLAVTGQGRGIPDVIIGGQQAEIDKEAAIQSLPIAAQLSAAQGDLQTAQDQVDTLFKLQSEDATNQATYQNNLITSVYNFATDEQKDELDKMNTANSEAFTTQQNNLNYAQGLATTAIANGQPSIAAQIMKLDPTSPTYEADVSTFAQGITVQKTPSPSTTEGPDLAASVAYLTKNPGNATQAKQTFLAAHPDGSAAWDSYWGVTTANPDGNYPSAPAAAKSGLFGLGFFGL